MNFKRMQTVEMALSPGRVLIIYGPRRIGKTTLLKEYLKKQEENSSKKIAYFSKNKKALITQNLHYFLNTTNLLKI